MGLSAASMNPISSIEYRVTTPQAYNVENQSEVSDSFVEAMQSVGYANRVEASSPVQYATASVSTNRISQLERNRDVNQAYNDIAAGFNGVGISYGSNMQNTNYAVVGSQLDLFA